MTIREVVAGSAQRALLTLSDQSVALAAPDESGLLVGRPWPSVCGRVGDRLPSALGAVFTMHLPQGECLGRVLVRTGAVSPAAALRSVGRLVSHLAAIKRLQTPAPCLEPWALWATADGRLLPLPVMGDATEGGSGLGVIALLAQMTARKVDELSQLRPVASEVAGWVRQGRVATMSERDLDLWSQQAIEISDRCQRLSWPPPPPRSWFSTLFGRHH
jgi:hypothetical protein